MSVLVDIAAAIICFSGECHPALVGPQTPVGTYQLEQFTIEDPRFGGDLLVFKIEDRTIFAVHRVFKVAGQRRSDRLDSMFASHRNNVTGGCVNVAHDVYAKLVECCSTSTIVVK